MEEREKFVATTENEIKLKELIFLNKIMVHVYKNLN